MTIDEFKSFFSESFKAEVKEETEEKIIFNLYEREVELQKSHYKTISDKIEVEIN